MEAFQQSTCIDPKKYSKYIMWLAIFLVMFGFLDKYITCAIGIAYPTFKSFLALESDKADDDKQWLTYWVVYGAFTIVDMYAGFILQFIPFYFFLKLIFLLGLMHPETGGAKYLYDHYLEPFGRQADAKLQQLDAKASSEFNKAKDMAKAKVDEAKNKIGKGKGAEKVE